MMARKKSNIRSETVKMHETRGAMKKHMAYKLYIIEKIMGLRKEIKEDRDKVFLAWGNVYINNNPEHIERRNAHHAKREERQREEYQKMDFPKLLSVYRDHIELRVAEKIRVGTL